MLYDSINMNEDSDEEDDSMFPYLENIPTEYMSVMLHAYTGADFPKIVYADFLVETMIYQGSEELGDLDQYGLTPVCEDRLEFTSSEMMNNTWLEFNITKNELFEKEFRILFETSDIYMSDEFPMEIKGVDRNNSYELFAWIVFENDCYYFEHLAIRTFAPLNN